MKINKITITNFRQYHGTNVVEFHTETPKNIVLIWGKNGYGKTNLMMSLLWCFYGEDILKIDNTFKREISKDGGYLKYLKASLNWDAEKESESIFSVEVEINGVEYFQINNAGGDITCDINKLCTIRRVFDSHQIQEDFSIDIPELSEEINSSQEMKKMFVNDYLIPLEAAKFIFFDAEKISNWAELSSKDEGVFLSDALSKILGLDIYQALILDLAVYMDLLKKESATSLVKKEIIAKEKGIAINYEELECVESRISEIKDEIVQLNKRTQDYDLYLKRYSASAVNNIDIDKVYVKKSQLISDKEKLEGNYSSFVESIPFAILSVYLDEVIKHIIIQKETKDSIDINAELVKKNTFFLEQLFNKPPFPEEGDISFADKMFYVQKANNIIKEITDSEKDKYDIEFDYDLSNSDIQLINEIYDNVKKQSIDYYEEVIASLRRIHSELTEINQVINIFEIGVQDEDVLGYIKNKKLVEIRKEELLSENGALIEKIKGLKKNIDIDEKSLQISIKKITVSEIKQKQIKIVTKYISSLRTFIDNQKRIKCLDFERAILQEMQMLMHKLKVNENTFIASVNVALLPEDDGLNVTLIGRDGQVIPKEALSQGEKQMYVSSLIKAIISLSVREYPVFIDTPLSKLDDEHIKNTLIYFYPDLAAQVVLMATDNEIPLSRFDLIKNNLSDAYSLIYKNSQTKFKMENNLL